MHFCKACRGRLRTLPSMPRNCQASLHILGSHIYIYIYIINKQYKQKVYKK